MTGKPKKLRPGDTIGVISPAGCVSKRALVKGLEVLESFGFKVCLTPHVYDRENYLAGSDEARLSDFHEVFLDPNIKGVLCARGGYGAMRLLPKVRYDLIAQNPKFLVGFSDITALLIAVHARCGLITVHGPTVRSLGTGDLRSRESLLRLLTGGRPLSIPLEEGGCLFPGKATGPVIGGNLSLICHLMGTPYEPPLQGSILFIEDCGEPLYRVDRMLTYLALTGGLKKISGIIVGTFDDSDGRLQVEELVKERLEDFRIRIPAATGLPIGHGETNLALPLGARAELDTESMTLTVTENCAG